MKTFKEYAESCCEECFDHVIEESEYQGKKVKLNDPTRASDAKRRCRKIMDVGESEFIVCTSDAVHVMYPELVPEYDDPLA